MALTGHVAFVALFVKIPFSKTILCETEKIQSQEERINTPRIKTENCMKNKEIHYLLVILSWPSSRGWLKNFR